MSRQPSQRALLCRRETQGGVARVKSHISPFETTSHNWHRFPQTKTRRGFPGGAFGQSL
jgi:hypothetical protein